MDKRFNMNSILLALFTMVVAGLGWTVKMGVNDIRYQLQNMIPRQEVTIMIQSLEQNMDRERIQRERDYLSFKAELVELRARITKIEIDSVKTNELVP